MIAKSSLWVNIVYLIYVKTFYVYFDFYKGIKSETISPKNCVQFSRRPHSSLSCMSAWKSEASCII